MTRNLTAFIHLVSYLVLKKNFSSCDLLVILLTGSLHHFNGVFKNKELTNRRRLHEGAIRLRDMPTAHAYLGTCRNRTKVDDVGEGDLPAS